MDITNPRDIIPKSEFNMNTTTILLLFKDREIGVVVFMPFFLPKDMLMSNYLEDKFGEKNCFIGNRVATFSSPQGIEPHMELGGIAKVGIWYDGGEELQVFNVRHGHWRYGENHGWAEFNRDWIVGWDAQSERKRAYLCQNEIREEDILEIFTMTEERYAKTGKESERQC